MYIHLLNTPLTDQGKESPSLQIRERERDSCAPDERMREGENSFFFTFLIAFAVT